MKLNTYEFNGVMEYANCFSFEIEAVSKKEAIEKSKIEVKRHIDSSNTEFQKYIIDKPILIK